MNQKPEDHLDHELESLERAYGALAQDEPPELIDQAVLNRAKRAAGGDAGRRPWSFGWIHGLTSAAIVVLAVAIYTQQPDPGDSEPMRVAKPPSSALRDVEAEIQPLQIPARQASTEKAPHVNAPEPRRRAPTEAKSAVAEFAETAADATEAVTRREVLPQGPEASGARLDQRTDADEEIEDPDHWLERIRELKRDGEDERAAQELEAFRQSWPDYPVPPELLD